MIELGEERGLPIHLPPMPFCLDNAAMIAGLADTLLAAGKTDDLSLPAIATTSLK
jgi:tRNA A37 threonylcarbamoyltransferase TsaD